MKTMNGIQIRVAAVGISLALLAGCTTSGPKTAAKPAAKAPSVAARPADLQFSGKIIRVNAEDGYVVVECAVLPNVGEEARVCRNEREVGRVRFSGPFSFPYAIADVIGGQLMTGDRVRQ